VRYLAVLAIAGLLVGIVIGAIGSNFGLDRAEILVAVMAGGVLAIAVGRVRGGSR
jgi:hypothetical protein